MKPLPATSELLAVAERVVWFKAPSEVLADLLHHASGSGPFSIGCDFENGVVTRFLST
jgi:hypothetical protein